MSIPSGSQERRDAIKNAFQPLLLRQHEDRNENLHASLFAVVAGEETTRDEATFASSSDNIKSPACTPIIA